MAKQANNPKAAGRPAGSDNDKVRGDLLNAAREHFMVREFKATSVREIAASAGVNAAMVNYYFGGKQGLYLAMIDELLAQLEASMKSLNLDSGITVADFSGLYTKILAENPWWPNFMVREVLFNEGETQAAMIGKFQTALAPLLFQSIEKEVASGNFREDLDPGLTLVSLMGMTIFPFLAKPMMEKVLNVTLDEATVEKLAQHNTKLFLHGVEAVTNRGIENE